MNQSTRRRWHTALHCVAIMGATLALVRPVAARPPADELVGTGAEAVSCYADPPARTIVAGGSVTFRGWLRGGPSRAIYGWEFPGGRPALAGSTLNPPSVTYGVPGEYRARFSARDEVDGQAICSVEAIVTVEP